MKKREFSFSELSNIRFHDIEERESSSEEENETKQDLGDVTFEDLQKARSDGSKSVFVKPNQGKKVRRANKNRPMETTSKKPVGRFREVVQAPKKVVRDPRFESLCGKLNAQGFKKRYNFLFENNLPAEKELKKTKNPIVADNLKNRISWIDRQLKPVSTKHTDNDILVAHKKKEREAAKQGKHPFYLKKSEIRKQGLMEKYESLKGSGRLDAFIDKKRKKNASKDHRFIPYRRSDDNNQHENQCG